MTSRERVLLAINHRRTDRAPADYSAHTEVNTQMMAKLGVADYEGLLPRRGALSATSGHLARCSGLTWQAIRPAPWIHLFG